MPADTASGSELSRTHRLQLTRIAAAAVLALGLLTAAVAARAAFLTRPDQAVTRAALTVVHHDRAILGLFRAATRLGDPLTVNVVCALWALGALGRRRWLVGIAVVAARLVALGAEHALKAAVDRPRPHVLAPVEHAAGASFPSGHTTGTATLAALAIVLVWTGRSADAQMRRRWTITAALVLVTVVVAASRVMLGVHYLSDVIGGICLGVAVAVATVLVSCSVRRR